jgi:hypothetical protein
VRGQQNVNAFVGLSRITEPVGATVCPRLVSASLALALPPLLLHRQSPPRFCLQATWSALPPLQSNPTDRQRKRTNKRANPIDKESERTREQTQQHQRHSSSLSCGRPGLQPLLPTLPQARLQSLKTKKPIENKREPEDSLGNRKQTTGDRKQTRLISHRSITQRQRGKQLP